MILSKFGYNSKHALGAIGLVIFSIVLLVPLRAHARLPDAKFAAKRLLKVRSAKSFKVKISVFGKQIERYRGTVRLFNGAFALPHVKTPHKKLTVSNTPSQKTHLQLIWIALASSTVFADVESIFGPLGKQSKVSVDENKMVYRYGSSPQISVFRNSANLSEVRVKVREQPWVLKLNRLEKGLEGAVYRGGLIVSRFTILPFGENLQERFGN